MACPRGNTLLLYPHFHKEHPIPDSICLLLLSWIPPGTALSLKCTNQNQYFWFSRSLFLLMTAGLMDVIGRQDSRLRQSPEHTLRMVLFKIFFNVLFSLCTPVDSAFYLICPKHTSLIFAAGCVRGSVSQLPRRGFRSDIHSPAAPVGGLQRAAY